MIHRVAFLVIGLTVILAAIFIAAWRRRFRDRRLMLCAHVDAALRNAWGGETFVATAVESSFAWSRGRVVLSVPTGWDFLIKEAWERIVDALPENYDLVIRGAYRPAGLSAPVSRGGRDTMTLPTERAGNVPPLSSRRCAKTHIFSLPSLSDRLLFRTGRRS